MLLSLFAAQVLASTTLPPGVASAENLPPNLLLVVVDDLGVDQLAAYQSEAVTASTPSLDLLWSRGILFTDVWSAPVCSPTRAHLLTGRHGFRTGIGYLTQQPDHVPLGLDEVSLPELLDAGTGGLYAHACFGKWHLGTTAEVGGLAAPNNHGYGHFAGTEGNLVAAHVANPVPVDFFKFFEIVDGVEQYVTDSYATTHTIDRTLDWIQSTAEPWFAHVNLHAPHAPWHVPPDDLHTVDLSGFESPADNPNAHYRAAVEALDTELGRLFATLGDQLDRTVVVVVSDNGSPGEVVVPPYNPGKAKTTLFQGGINVPMIVSGPGFAEGFAVCPRPLQTTDLFATLLELAGVDLETTPGAPAVHDSVSIVPYLLDPTGPALREWLYAERFLPTGPGPWDSYQQAARDSRYKLIRGMNLPKQFYDLWSDPQETLNLLNGKLSVTEQRALRQLELAVDGLQPLP